MFGAAPAVAFYSHSIEEKIMPELKKSGKVAPPGSTNPSAERIVKKVCYPVFGKSQMLEYLTLAEVEKAEEEEWARVMATVPRV
jgi:hypothetical protein